MTPEEAFFTVHRDLPREGPGMPEDVLWALDVAGTPEKARICDVACGPGADTVTLARARPLARIDALDTTPQFIDAAKVRVADFGPRVQAMVRDFADLPDDYDLIWCAGAAYFLGFETALDIWRDRLLPSGAIAFSEPAWVSEPPAPAARAFWEEYPAICGISDLKVRLEAAGWRVEAERWLIGAPWEAYYRPMKERLALLKRDALGAPLAAAIAETEREIANWERAPDKIAYVLFVVRPA